MLFFLLILTLHPQVGDPEVVKLGGTKPYPTLEACQDEAQRIGNWLTQDMVRVEFTCTRVETRDNRHKFEG